MTVVKTCHCGSRQKLPSMNPHWNSCHRGPPKAHASLSKRGPIMINYEHHITVMMFEGFEGHVI